MIIECPHCQNQLNTEGASLTPEGMQVLCDRCNATFTIRPHQAEEEQQVNGPIHPPAPPPLSTGEGGESQSETAPPGFPEHFFLQRDEIPHRMVLAYEQGEREKNAHLMEDIEPNLLSQNIRHEDMGSEQDIPIVLDDSIEEKEIDVTEGFPATSYPATRKIPGPKSRRSNRSGVGLGIGTALLALLVLVMLFSKNIRQETWTTLKAVWKTVQSVLPFKEMEKGKLQFSNLAHDFVSRGKEKTTVFVIEGKVTNHYKRACHSVQIKGILFNEKGKRTAEETVFCGNVVKKAQIQSLSRKEIEERLQNTYGAGLSNFNIQPGGSIPFMLVFFDPPEKVSEFSIEIADYKLEEPSVQNASD